MALAIDEVSVALIYTDLSLNAAYLETTKKTAELAHFNQPYVTAQFDLRYV